MFKPSKKQLIFFFAFSSVFLLLVFSSLPLRQFVSEASAPPLSLAAFIKRQIGGIIFYNRNLSQNEALSREAAIIRSKLNSVNEYYLENLRLKELISFKNKSPLRLIAARVIARSSEDWSSGLTIDKGSSDGLRPGMSVINYLGLLGRVVQVTSSTGKVMLLSDPNLGVSSIIQRSRQEGLVCGTLGGNLVMKYLPEEADVKVNDIVLSSGLNNNYPKGILIGTVIEVGKEFSGLSRYALVKPAVNLANIEEVLVVVP